MQTWEEKKFNNTGVDSVLTKKRFPSLFFQQERGEKRKKAKTDSMFGTVLWFLLSFCYLHSPLMSMKDLGYEMLDVV